MSTRVALILVILLSLVAVPVFASGQLQIVAHEDDDLYFMTPAVPNGVASGAPSWTVFLSAGDAGRTDGHWQSRELGIRAAYALMRGLPDVWSALPLSIEGRSLAAFQLTGAPEIVVVFLRLPDGNPNGTGYAVTGNESLEILWEGGPGETIHPVDGSAGYSRVELIDLLTEIIRDRDPNVLRIQDMTAYHGSDHSDHIHSGRFAFEAHLASGDLHRLLAYRAYNINGQPVNLSSTEIAQSNSIITTYGAFDAGVGPNGWNQREIPIGDLFGAHASLVVVSGPRTGECLNVTNPGTSSEVIGFAPCTDATAQSFFLTSRDLRHGDHCLTESSGSFSFKPCGLAPGQGWTFFSDGHLRGPNEACMIESAGNAVVTPCVGSSRFWEMGAKEDYAAGAGTDFSTIDLGTDPSRYLSLEFGDIDGNGQDDACVRRADGIYCARTRGAGEFDAAELWHSNFGDDDAWGPPQYGTTIMLGDLDGDGDDDLCGRGSAGILCVTSSGTSFGSFANWTSFFSDADGGAAPSTYGSLRLGDVDGDGLADLCGWRGVGVHCQINQGGSFGAPTAWAASGWVSALNLPSAQQGQTMMLGDIDGDGADDLCERGDAGVYCAIADPVAGAFVDRAMRSQAEYSNGFGWGGAEGYWGTLRLGDLSGDGRADLCGRGAAGVLCLYSLEGRFSAINHRLTAAFSNAAGFFPAERARTFHLADIDGDGRADLCASDATTLRCARQDDPLAAPEPGLSVGLALGVLLVAGARDSGARDSRAQTRRHAS